MCGYKSLSRPRARAAGPPGGSRGGKSPQALLGPVPSPHTAPVFAGGPPPARRGGPLVRGDGEGAPPGGSRGGQVSAGALGARPSFPPHRPGVRRRPPPGPEGGEDFEPALDSGGAGGGGLHLAEEEGREVGEEKESPPFTTDTRKATSRERGADLEAPAGGGFDAAEGQL